MKKLLAMVMAVAMTLSLAACGGNSTPAASGSTGSASSEAGSAANTDFKVGAIYINSKNDTAGYTYAHHNGITTAMKELGLDPDSQLVIVDEVTTTMTRSPTPWTPWWPPTATSSSPSPSAICRLWLTRLRSIPT